LFHTSRGFASREAAFPRYRHVLPPPGAGALRRNVRGPTCGTGEIPGSNRVRAHTPLSRETGARGAPGHGFPLGIALTAPAPRGGGGGRRPGGVGATEEAYGYPPAKAGRGGGCRRGTFGYLFVREGDEPPPRSPPPVAIATTVQCTGTSLENRVLALSSPGKPLPALLLRRGRRGALHGGWDEGRIGPVHLESMQ